MANGGIEPALIYLGFLGACGVSLGLAGLFAELTLRGRPRALAVPTAALILAAGAAFLGQPTPVLLSLLALVYLFAAFHTAPVRRAWDRVRSLGRDPRFLWGGLVLAGLLVAFWQPGLIEPTAPAVKADTADRLPPEEFPLKEDASVHAVTDKGRPVRLYYAEAGEIEPAAMLAVEANKIRPWALSTSMIRTEKPDVGYNCHGWTFADGHHWILNNDVNAILADNGYRPVKQPRPGDLAVYHSGPGGEVIHSGVVRVAGPDKVILVESKWGWLGRYVHTPEAQLYGRSWVYYHSDRNGHRLRGLDDSHQPPPARETTTHLTPEAH
jgi:hypothetical protein